MPSRTPPLDLVRDRQMFLAMFALRQAICDGELVPSWKVSRHPVDNSLACLLYRAKLGHRTNGFGLTCKERREVDYWRKSRRMPQLCKCHKAGGKCPWGKTPNQRRQLASKA